MTKIIRTLLTNDGPPLIPNLYPTIPHFDHLIRNLDPLFPNVNGSVRVVVVQVDRVAVIDEFCDERKLVYSPGRQNTQCSPLPCFWSSLRALETGFCVSPVFILGCLIGVGYGDVDDVDGDGRWW